MKVNPTKTANELITILPYITDIEGKKEIYHAWRVAILSAAIAKDIASPRILKEIFYASLLHDIGAVGFPLHIIHYLRRKDKASQSILLSHPIIGAELISNIPEMTQVAKLILDHHEWVNGKGYPRAKIGNHIPWGSQIIRIADSIDILIQSERFHKLKNLRREMSLNIDREYSKKLFQHAFDRLKKDKFFYKLCNRSYIPHIFNEVKERVGLIRIPSKIDAIGTTLEVAAQIIDMKHPFTSGHSLRVSRYAMAIALAMNLSHDEITSIRWAGLIHDIGKLSIPRSILDKPTTLSRKEFEVIKKHARLTENILKKIATLKEVIPIAANHHEYFDGTGYPHGLKGEEIPLGARILTVCDAFDAMTSNRPYRKPRTPESACQEIEKLSNKQFDAEIVKQAVPLFKNLGL